MINGRYFGKVFKEIELGSFWNEERTILLYEIMLKKHVAFPGC